MPFLIPLITNWFLNYRRSTCQNSVRDVSIVVLFCIMNEALDACARELLGEGGNDGSGYGSDDGDGDGDCDGDGDDDGDDGGDCDGDIRNGW